MLFFFHVFFDLSVGFVGEEKKKHATLPQHSFLSITRFLFAKYKKPVIEECGLKKNDVPHSLSIVHPIIHD